jgi:hypothetical protein
MKKDYTIEEIVDKIKNHIEEHFIPESRTTDAKLTMFQDALAYDHTSIQKNIKEFGSLDKADKTIFFKTYPDKDFIDLNREGFKESLIRDDSEFGLISEVDNETKEVNVKEDFDIITKAVGNGIGTIRTYKDNLKRIKDTRYLLNQDGIMSERLCRLSMLMKRNEMLCVRLTALNVFKKHGFSNLTEELLKQYPAEDADPFNIDFVFFLIMDMAYSNFDSLKIAETLEIIKIRYQNKNKEFEQFKKSVYEFVIGKNDPLFVNMQEYLDTVIEYYTDQMCKLTYDMINDNLTVFDYANYPIQESHEHHHHDGCDCGCDHH